MVLQYHIVVSHDFSIWDIALSAIEIVRADVGLNDFYNRFSHAGQIFPVPFKIQNPQSCGNDNNRAQGHGQDFCFHACPAD
jgi:hypothetical protein